eukprot:PRCOL_00003950-RA
MIAEDVLAFQSGVTKGAPCADALEVEGLASLSGHVSIDGAKNSALVVMAGAVLCKGELMLRRIPDLTDIASMSSVLRSIGCRVTPDADGPGSLLIDASCLTSCEPSEESVKRLRASFFVTGALLARKGEARVPLPGGCDIGARPVDLHIRGLRALGATIYLDYPSVGATETILMAAVGAEGDTTIANVAQEPEVVDLAHFLISMGAKIEGAGTNSIYVRGTGSGGLGPTDFTIIPDRIEAGTFLVAGAITGSVLSLSPVVPSHLTAAIAKLQEMGCQVLLDGPERMRIIPTAALKPTDLTTLPYPGFPTDLQSQFVSLLAHAHGTSIVRETVFEKRMGTVSELKRMGANIKLIGSDTAIVEGGWMSGAPLLQGIDVTASDLRSGAALVLAGLAAEGVTTVHGLKHMDRGYCNFEGKLNALGANVRRIHTGDAREAR